MIKYILPFSIKWRKKVDLNFDENGVAPTWRLSQLSPEERSVVVDTLAERLQNSFHMVAKSRVEQVLTLLEDREIREEDKITIVMDMVFVWQDILEIVGGLRRREIGNGG